jgi:hypothetical protein
MNEGQLAKHWRLWSAACQANGWKTSDDAQRYAQYAAVLNSQGVTAERYSVKDFTTQPQIDALFDHFTQLATHNTNLTAAIRQANPEIGDRKRLIWSIKNKADDAYIRHIAVNKFGHADLGALDLSQLTQLRNTLSARATAKTKKRLLPVADRHASKQKLAAVAKEATGWGGERWGEAPAEPSEDSNTPF